MFLRAFWLLFFFPLALLADETEPDSDCAVEKEEEQDDSEEECDTKEAKPLPIGNFALPLSQQIAPLVSFGQLEIGPKDLQYYLLGDFFWGSKTYTTFLTPAILYGVTDEIDIYLQLPVSTGERVYNHTSGGLEDFILQFEYAYYSFTSWCYTNQATVVASISYPTGNPYKMPPTGYGAPAFFLGGTFSHVSQWWYAFASFGGLFPTENKGLKFGDSILYQCGFERVICAIPDCMIFAWMVEFDGTYTKKNWFRGHINSNTGGNVILVTPSLWYSTKHWILQGGVGIPVVQHLNGNQPKNSAALFFILGYNV